MTLRLVDTQVSDLPVRNLMDIAAMARGFGDDLDAGEHGEISRVLVIAEGDEGLKIYGWGENTSPYEMMGLFEAAKLTVFADFVTDD
jgi:hypothetical protein